MYVWICWDLITDVQLITLLWKTPSHWHMLAEVECEKKVWGMFLLASFCTRWVIGSLSLLVTQTCFQEQNTASASLPWKAATRAHRQQWTPGRVSKSLPLLHCQKTDDLTYAHETHRRIVLLSSQLHNRQTDPSVIIHRHVSTVGTFPRDQKTFEELLFHHRDRV